MRIHITLTANFLAFVLALGFPVMVWAQEQINLNPPAEPIKLGTAVLTYQRTVSVPRLSIPGSFSITDIVSNTGTISAQNLTIRQELPAGWTADGASNLVIALGDLGADETTTRTTTINVTETAEVGRYANDAILTANNLDPVEASVVIDLSKPAVLGASTLAETGLFYPSLVLMGLSLVFFGSRLVSRRTSD